MKNNNELIATDFGILVHEIFEEMINDNNTKFDEDDFSTIFLNTERFKSVYPDACYIDEDGTIVKIYF